MGCKHELPQCRSGDSSRAVSAFVQFAGVINGAVRKFSCVWFKGTALELLGQMCLMWRDTCTNPGPFGGAQPHCGSPQPWGITPKLCLTPGHGAVPFPAQQTSHGNSLENNHLTQHQSHKLSFTYHRDTGPGVCLLFQKTPSSSSSLPPSSFFFFCTCIRMFIPGLCAHEMERKRKVSQFKNKHCSEPSLRKTWGCNIKDCIYPGSYFISQTYI